MARFFARTGQRQIQRSGTRASAKNPLGTAAILPSFSLHPVGQIPAIGILSHALKREVDLPVFKREPRVFLGPVFNLKPKRAPMAGAAEDLGYRGSLVVCRVFRNCDTQTTNNEFGPRPETS
jgi:hypothetical protein